MVARARVYAERYANAGGGMQGHVEALHRRELPSWASPLSAEHRDVVLCMGAESARKRISSSKWVAPLSRLQVGASKWVAPLSAPLSLPPASKWVAPLSLLSPPTSMGSISTEITEIQ